MQRLHAAGWTADRKVDISSIEKQFNSAQVVLPDKLKEFFTSFGFLKFEYEDGEGKRRRQESHTISPFFDYKKEFYAHLLDCYDVHGMAYPVGTAHRANMDIIYHGDGNFYLFMGGGPVIRCGNSAESFFEFG